MFLLVICFLSGDKDISRKWAHRGHTPSLFRVSFIPHLTDKAVCKTIRGVFISHRSSLTGVKGLFSAPFALSVDKTNGKVLRKFYQKFNSSIWIPFDFHEKFYFADCRQFFAFHGNKSSWIRIFLSHPGQAFSPAPLRRLGRNMVDNVKFIKIDYISWYLFHGGFFLTGSAVFGGLLDNRRTVISERWGDSTYHFNIWRNSWQEVHELVVVDSIWFTDLFRELVYSWSQTKQFNINKQGNLC